MTAKTQTMTSSEMLAKIRGEKYEPIEPVPFDQQVLAALDDLKCRLDDLFDALGEVREQVVMVVHRIDEGDIG